MGELEILKLQWHVQILQAILAKVYVSAYRTSPETSASTQEDDPQSAYRSLLAELEAAQRLGYQTYLSPAVAEERRILLAEEFAQLVDEIKTTFIPPDILARTASPEESKKPNHRLEGTAGVLGLCLF